MRRRARPFDAACKRLFSHPRMAADLARLLDDGTLGAVVGAARHAGADGRQRAAGPLRTLEYRLVDVKARMGDDASDGNLCRAVFALDAAPAEGVPAAFGRVKRTAAPDSGFPAAPRSPVT